MRKTSVVNGSGLVVSSAPNVSVTRVHSGYEGCGLRRGLKVVVVSCLRLVDKDKGDSSERRRVSSVSHSLGTLTERLGIPIVTLSRLDHTIRRHPSREPVLSSLQRSKTVRRSTSIMVFVCESSCCRGSARGGSVTRVVVTGREGNPVKAMRLM